MIGGEYVELEKHVGHLATVESCQDEDGTKVVVIHCSCGDDLVAAEKPRVKMVTGYRWLCKCGEENWTNGPVKEVTCQKCLVTSDVKEVL